MISGGRTSGVDVLADGLERAVVIDVGEERGEAVEVFLRVRVELVVVALGAAHRAGEPGFGKIPHAVGLVDRAVLGVLRAAFVRRLQQAVVAGGDALPERRIRQQVAGELLDRELVERQIVVERLDHVVAVGRDAVLLVAVVADRVGEPHQVEPPRGHPLAEGRRREQLVDELLVGVGAVVEHELRRLSSGVGGRPVRSKYSRRMSVRRSASGDGSTPAASSRASTKRSTSLRGQSALCNVGHGRPLRRNVRPMGLVLRAGVDPAAERFDLRRRERQPLRIGRRHHQLRGRRSKRGRSARSSSASPATIADGVGTTPRDRAASRPAGRRSRGRGR